VKQLQSVNRTNTHHIDD